MKYAIVDDERREASRELKGTCPLCEVPLKARCGRFRVNHWAHPPGTVDHHWEPETEWHRKWKDFFPKECQEVVHVAENGERHFADVKTAQGHVIEFQNSPISEEERSSREAIYRPMYWVVNGLRLKNDRQKFIAALRLAEVVQTEPLNMLVSTANCLLLRKWENSGVPVFFDFGEIEEEGDPFRFGAPVLWASRPGTPQGRALLVPMYRDGFLQGMINNERLPGIRGVLPPRRVPNFTAPMSGQPWRRPRRNWRL